MAHDLPRPRRRRRRSTPSSTSVSAAREGLDDIRPFLANVLRGRRIPPARIEEVAHHYELFGGVSPITAITERQARALEAALRARGLPLPVHVGMRNWRPMLADTCRALHADGARRLLVLIAAAHRSYSSCEQYRQNLWQAQEELRARRAAAVRHRLRRRLAPGAPASLDAVAERIAAARATLPDGAARRARGWSSPRTRSRRRWPRPIATCMQLRDSATAVAALLHARRLGAGVPEPQRTARGSVARAGRERLPARGARRRACEAAILVPIGFLADHVEVLYDLDVEARATADEIGLTLARAEAVNDHPRFIDALADVVSEAVSRYGRGRPLSIVPAEPPAKRELPPPVRPAAAT